MNEQQKRWAKALAELKAQQRRGRHRRTQPAGRIVVGRRDPDFLVAETSTPAPEACTHKEVP